MLNLYMDALNPSYIAPVAVVIPIYKSQLSKLENISLDRCLKVLGHHPIVVIAPEKLPLENIDFKDASIRVEYFDKDYFRGVNDYSRLMLSAGFYRRFLPYKYILIYQLDAFVFSDCLLEWCGKDFDYIGAPWFNQQLIDYWSQNLTCLRWIFKKLGIPFENRVGNGGLSLRNTRSFFLISILFHFVASHWTSRSFPNEDLFFAYFVTSYFPFFKIADLQSALSFSFEYSPSECYKLNNYQLPFGCHAWDKPINTDFWRDFFQKLGYSI